MNATSEKKEPDEKNGLSGKKIKEESSDHQDDREVMGVDDKLIGDDLEIKEAQPSNGGEDKEPADNKENY